MFALLASLPLAATSEVGGAVVGTITGGGVAALVVRWLTRRDDDREASRAEERREFLAALNSQRETFAETVRGVQQACRDEREAILRTLEAHRVEDRAARARQFERFESAFGTKFGALPCQHVDLPPKDGAPPAGDEDGPRG